MKILSLFILPIRDFWRGYERVLEGRIPGLLSVMVGMLVGWFIYIPFHELMHAFACMATGGEVTRLEIDAMYGGALLAKVFPWVYSGSDYAGQLTGFDTGGSDLVYLATDFGPFVLTLFPAVWLLRRFGRQGAGLRFGLVLPFALAPFLSITGDAYEIGSILVTQVSPWSGEELKPLLRGDDLFKKAEELREAAVQPWAGYVLAVTLGVLWAFCTYGIGAAIASRLPGGAPAGSERKGG